MTIGNRFIRRFSPFLPGAICVLLFVPTAQGQDAWTSRFQQARQQVAAGNYSHAAPTLQELLKLRRDAEVLYLLGFIAIQEFRYADAETYLREAVSSDPDQPGWFHALAKAQLEQNRNRAAIQSIERALALREDPDYHFARAACFLNLGELDSAESSLQRTVQLDARNAEAFFKLGKVSTDRGQPVKSIGSLESALRLNPGHLEAHFLLGLARTRMRDDTLARTHFETVLRRVPGHVGALYNLGRVLIRLGERDLGRQRLEEFQRMSQVQDEIEFQRAKVRKNPGSAPSRLALAQLLLQAGTTQEALDNLLVAARISPRQAEVFRLLEETFERMGRSEDSRRAAARANALEGNRR